MTDQEKLERRIARIIKKEVFWYTRKACGSEEEFDKSCLLAAKSILKTISKSYLHRSQCVPINTPKWKCPSCFGISGVDRIKKDYVCKDCGKTIDNQDAIDYGVFW